jgi:hypothetical protein
MCPAASPDAKHHHKIYIGNVQRDFSQDFHFSLPAFSSHLTSSIKGEVKKKHNSCDWNFSCFPAHWIKRDLF